MLNEEVKEDAMVNVQKNGNVEDETNLIGTTSSELYEKHNGKIPEPKISTREAYFSALNMWVKNANAAQEAMSLFPYFMLSTFPNLYQQPFNFGSSSTKTLPPIPTPINNSVNNDRQGSEVDSVSAVPESTASTQNENGNANAPHINFLRILNSQAQTELINRQGGYEYVMAPFWKRAAAEIIDMVVLLLIKVITAFMLLTVSSYDWNLDSNNDAIYQAIDKVDFSSFVNFSLDMIVFSSNFLLLELTLKFIVCIYEAFWITYENGATIGKAAMNLRVVHCEAIQPVPQAQQEVPQVLQVERHRLKVLIYPAKTPSFTRALLRAATKNLFMTILFPICLFMIFFKNNRTSYDIVSKTAVVENNPNAVLVRRANNQ